MQIIEKKISKTIDSIETFFGEHYYQVTFSHESIDKAVAKTIKKNDGLFFEFAKMILTSQKDVHALLDNDESPIIFSDFYRKIYFKISSCTGFKVQVGFTGHTNVQGYINEFTTSSLQNNHNAFFRAVVLTEEDFALSSHFECATNLKVGNVSYGSGVFEVSFLGMEVHLFSYSDKVTKNKYFVVESREAVQYEKFISILDEIILAITYLTGTFIGHEFYIISSALESFEEENNVLSLKRFFDDLKSSYWAIPDIGLQQNVNVPVQRISKEQFERFVEELFTSLIYKRTILLLCQAHLEPHYVKSTLYSVALETITNLVSEKISEKISPIPDKAFARRVRKKLTDSLQEFRSQLGADVFSKIEADINRINSPTNKQKLLAPFKHLGINLPEKDAEAISRRNDFLHGRIPEGPDKHHLALINARLLFCVNCLILRHIDYHGYIMYHPVMYQYNNRIELDGLPICKI